MKRNRSLVMLVVVLSLTACQVTQEMVHRPIEPLLDDGVFPNYTLFPIESAQEIFALDDDAKTFVERTVRPHKNPNRQIQALINAIFDRSDFNLLYSNDANTTASESFNNRSANCLSMSIMTYALAKHIGFDVRFQDIQIPEYWTRREGVSLLNGHINVLLRPRAEENVIMLQRSDVVVDFDPQDRRNHFPAVVVSRAKVVAMFYNNKGADALLANAYTRAYAYFRAAALLAPEFDDTWVNLGVLYRTTGQHQLARMSYQRAIQLDDDNLTAWENLAYLYQVSGNHDLSKQIIARVNRKRQTNPFYHFILGEEAFEQNRLDSALSHYTKAYRLDDDKHEILFGLSKTHYELGDINRAERYLRMAKRRAPNDTDSMRYANKLSHLLTM